MFESLYGLYTGGRALSIGFLIYLVNAFAFYRMSEKAGVRNVWLAFIPILQFILFFHMINKSAWHVLLLLIPIVNLILVLVWTYDLYMRFGISSGVAIIVLVLDFFTASLAGNVFKLYLAFSDDVSYVATTRYTEYY